MSNSYFSFKEFTIHQDKCGMKVSTDACIQGAWTPLKEGPIRVLDIGAGTGLLSLMIAQRNPLASIDAVEIDEDAANQARSNVAGSPFSEHIVVHHADAKTFAARVPYDLIICNPPFFKNSLLGDNTGRNAARHNLFLQQQDLIDIMNRHLSGQGYASIMWPVPEMDRWDKLTERQGWTAIDVLQVKDNEHARIHRSVGLYGKTSACPSSTTLIIKKEDGSYTTHFRELLSPFYLNIG